METQAELLSRRDFSTLDVSAFARRCTLLHECQAFSRRCTPSTERNAPSSPVLRRSVGQRNGRKTTGMTRRRGKEAASWNVRVQLFVVFIAFALPHTGGLPKRGIHKNVGTVWKAIALLPVNLFEGIRTHTKARNCCSDVTCNWQRLRHVIFRTFKL